MIIMLSTPFVPAINRIQFEVRLATVIRDIRFQLWDPDMPAILNQFALWIWVGEFQFRVIIMTGRYSVKLLYMG